MIASIIDASSLRDRDILDLGDDFSAGLYEIFPPDRAERADTLVDIVADWLSVLPDELPRATVAEVHASPSLEPAVNPIEPAPAADPDLGAPAFLRSDRVDEDDSVRIYGSARSYVRLVFAALSVLALAAVGVGVWFWANSRSTDPNDQVADEAVAGESVEVVEPTVDPLATPTPVPTATPVVVEPLQTTRWADTTTVLNGGASTILSSTYPVSAANRAILTGHSDAITGIVISDDGRVLTSGADQRLVDWGSDVTLASPDILPVDAPLTVLARTLDQKLVAGDANGNLTVIDLITPTDPLIVAVHGEAISAITELVDGRLAVASVDGGVAVFGLDDPTATTTLPHDLEVTAVDGLPDGSVVTAAVDGAVRIWPPSGGAPSAIIETLGAPVTAVHVLSDGSIAAASVDGRIHITAPLDAAVPELEIEAHAGAIRALFEFDDERFGRSLASGSDDTTIRLFSLESGQQWQQLDGHGDLVSAIEQLPDGRLVSTSADGTGRVWDLELAAGPIVEPPHEWNLSLMVPWRNDQFITGGSDGLVVLASTAETASPEPITRHDAPVVGLTVMPNGDIVSVDALSVLRLSQVGPEAAEPFELQLAPGTTSLDDRGGLGIVTGHADGTVRFSDFTAETAVVPAHGSGVNDVLGLSSGLVASAGNDNTVRIIDPEQPDLLPVFDLHTAPVDTLTELPDGRIASAGTDAIYVWSVDDMGAEHLRLSGHRVPTVSLLGLPDGRLLSAAVDGRVRVWDLQDPDADALTLIDVPGVVNPALIQADNGLFVAGAGRGYVVFTIE